MALFDKFKNIFNNPQSIYQADGRLKNKDTVKLDTLEEIQNIPIPKYERLDGIQAPVDNIEYVLHRKATQHKKNGRIDLAIACLWKANEIFPHSNFVWDIKNYLRLVEYLKLDRQFDEARAEEEKIKSMFKGVKSINLGEVKRTNIIGFDDKQIIDVFDGLVEFAVPYFCCSECSKYTRRIFTIDGKDSRFPMLPDEIKYKSEKHKHCHIALSGFLYGVNTPEWKYTGDLIEWSNRPYKDERTQEEIKRFDMEIAKIKSDERDKKFYDLIFEKCSDIAPKSLSGYKRMKSANSKNYQELLIKVKERLGYDFYVDNPN